MKSLLQLRDITVKIVIEGEAIRTYQKRVVFFKTWVNALKHRREFSFDYNFHRILSVPTLS